MSCSGVSELKCVRCSKQFLSTTPDFICSTCKEEEWANEIEEIMGAGKGRVSFTKAKQLVAKNNQAVCLCCDQPIPRGTKGRHLFCTNYKACRRAARRLKYLRFDVGLSKEDALTVVLKELSDKKRQAA